MIIFEEIKNLLLKYDRPDHYKVAIKFVMDRNIKAEIEQLIKELYEQMATNDMRCRVIFGDDLVDKIFEYKKHEWTLGVEYWHVEYRNANNEPGLAIIKCFADMSEDQIKNLVIDGSEVMEVYSLKTTSNTNHNKDFTNKHD